MDERYKRVYATGEYVGRYKVYIGETETRRVSWYRCTGVIGGEWYVFLIDKDGEQIDDGWYGDLNPKNFCPI